LAKETKNEIIETKLVMCINCKFDVQSVMLALMQMTLPGPEEEKPVPTTLMR